MKVEPAEERSKALPEVHDEDHEGAEPSLHVSSAKTSGGSDPIDSQHDDSNEASHSGDDSHESASEEKMTLLQVFASVLWAGLGVQSSKNRERDFRQGRLLAFVLVGLFMTACFIGTLYAIVSLVLANR